MKKIIILSVIYTFFLFPINTYSNVLEDKNIQLKDLKARIEKLEENSPELSKFVERDSSKRFKLGGYYVGQAVAIPENRAPSSFRKTEFELLAFIDFTENWFGLSEFEFELESDLNNEHSANREWGRFNTVIKLERAWIEYRGIEYFNIRLGLFFTQFGVINREHQQTILMATDRPLFLKSDPKTVSRQVSGFSIIGNISDLLDYEFYVGSNDADGSPLLAGSRIATTIPMENELTIGMSYQKSTRNGEPQYNAYGGDINFEWNWFQFKSELVKADGNHLGYFFQPSIKINRSIFYYRYDFADMDVDVTSEEDRTRHMLGTNYLVKGNMRLKLELNRIVYKEKNDTNGKNKDYSKLIGEIAFSF